MQFEFSTRKTRAAAYPLLFAYSRCISPYFGRSLVDEGSRDWVRRRAELKELERFKVEAERCSHKCYGALSTGSRILAREAYEQALFGGRATSIYSFFSPSFAELSNTFKKIKEEIGANFYGADLTVLSRYEAMLFHSSFRRFFTVKEFLALLALDGLAFQKVVDLRSPLFLCSFEDPVLPKTSFDWGLIISECRSLKKDIGAHIEHKRALRLGMASCTAIGFAFPAIALATFSVPVTAFFTLPLALYIASLGEAGFDPAGVLKRMLVYMEANSTVLSSFP